MVHSLLGGPTDVYLKRGKCILNVSTSPSSTGIISAVLSQVSSKNEDESQSFELSVYSQLEGFSCLGSFVFKLHSSLLKSRESEKIGQTSIVWHTSGNLLLIVLHGNLLLFGLKYLDKKHFNEEITFKEAVLRNVQLNLDDSLITEILSVSVTLQTSLKKLVEKQSDVSEREYVTCVTPLRDGHSLLAGTNKGLYRIIHSWKDTATFSLSLLDSSVSLKTASSDSSDVIALPKYAYKGFQGHILSRVWECSQRGVILNGTSNADEASVRASDAPSSGASDSSIDASGGQVEYTYSHISIQQVHCLPVRSTGGADLISSSCVVAIQSDGSLTFSCLHSGGDISPGGSLPVQVSGHIHPVVLTGYPLPRTLKAAKGLLYPCVYEKLNHTTEPVPASVRPSFRCSSYVTEYDALVKAQSDIDSGVNEPLKQQQHQKRKLVVNGHCEEEISTVLAVMLAEYTPLTSHHSAVATLPGTGASSVAVAPTVTGGGSITCILTALVNTKHMPLAVRDLPVPIKTKDASASSSGSGATAGVVVDDRMQSQSLVQWIVTVTSPAHGSSNVEFDCIQSVFVASQPCSRASESLKGTYTLSSSGNRLTAANLNGLISLRLNASLHVVTQCFDCHIYESSLLVSALGRLLLCHSTEGPAREDGKPLSLNATIQTIPMLSPLESTQRLRCPSQQEGIFYNANSGHLYLLNNLTTASLLLSTGGGPVQYLTQQETLLRGSEQSLQYDRIRVPRGLVEDVLVAQMVNKSSSGGNSNNTRGDSFVSTTGLIVACGGQVRTSFLNHSQSGGQGVIPNGNASAHNQDYLALIPGGSSGSSTSSSASKYVANCSVLYLLNRRTNKWRTTLLSIPSTNTQKDLTMGSNAGAQVGKFSKACLVVQIPHINEVLDGHVNAELAAATVAANNKSKAQNAAAAGLRLGQLGPGHKVGGGEGVTPEAEGSRMRSNSFTSITSITSSAVSHSHKYFLNKSRQLTNRTNSSIYSQITSSVAIAFHGTHTVILLTQRKSRYFLEIVSREASRESLSSGKPQPNVHQLIALPPGFLPLGLTTQDIVRVGGTSEGGISVTGGAGHGGWIAPSASIDPELLRRQSQGSTTVVDHSADLDTAGSTHSSAVNHDKDRHVVVGEKSCAAVLYSADGTFVAYSITTVVNETTTVTVGSAPKSPTKTGGKVVDFKVMELFSINVKQLLSSDADRRALLEPSALRKFTILPLNAALFASQQERHQLFTALSLPYVCLVLLSSTGTVYLADAYAKTLTVVPVPSAVTDISPVAASEWIGSSFASESVETAPEAHFKCDVVYNDSLLLHCEDKHDPTFCSRHLWLSLAHNYPEEEDSSKSETTSDYAVQVMTHNETDELFFANLHLTVPPSSSDGRGLDDSSSSSRLQSVLVPLGSGYTPFGHLPVVSGELFTMYLQEADAGLEENRITRQSAKVVGLKESLLMALILTYNTLRSRQLCVIGAGGTSCTCTCLAGEDHSCVALFNRPADLETALSTTLLITLHQALQEQKKHTSRFAYLLSCVEAHLRSVVTVPQKSPAKSGTGATFARCYQLLTSTLHSLDPLMLVEVVSRLARRLEPAMSKQLFPVCVGLTKTQSSDGQWRASGSAVDIIELFEMCLRDRLLHYCNRLLSVTCEHFGGSESHLTTVISLILSLEHLHLSLSGDNLQLVCECLEFCHRLEELLAVHSGEILNGVGAGGVGEAEIQRSRSSSVPGGNGRRRRALSDSYVETMVQNALNQIRKKRNQLTRADAASSSGGSLISSSAGSSSASTTPQQGYYLGYGVMWLINTTASLFADTPPPTASSRISSSGGGDRSKLTKKELNVSLKVDAFKYGAIDLLNKKLSPLTVNNILCGSSTSAIASSDGSRGSNVTVNPSITMCLLMVNIRDLLSTSKHYASAALLLSVMLRQRAALNWLHDHFDRHFECNKASESHALGAEAKVRRILFILRLNKVLTHGTRTAVYIALFNAEPPPVKADTAAKMVGRDGKRGATPTQGIAYSAQYLRRLIESEKIHTQSHSSGSSGGISGSFYVASTPRASHDHTGATTAAVSGALAGSNTPAAAAGHNRWSSESSYFELPEDLLERKGAALCAMDLAKALIVGLLLSGEEHCVYLLFKIVLPYMRMSEGYPVESEAAEVELIMRELFVVQRLTAVETSESVSPIVEEPPSGGTSGTNASQFYEVRDRASVIRIFRLMIEGDAAK